MHNDEISYHINPVTGDFNNTFSTSKTASGWPSGYSVLSCGRSQVRVPAIIKMVQTTPPASHADVRVGVKHCTRLSKRLGSVWNCLWEHALKRSPGINRKSIVSYPGPGFLSSVT